MLNRIAPLAVAVSLLTLTGCATVQVSREKANAVKSVAIIGFTGVTDLTEKDSNGKAKQTGGGIGGMITAVTDVKELGSGELDKRRMVQAEEAYKLLEAQLQTSVGWKVADRAQLAGDAEYGAVMKENPNTDSLRVAGLQRLPDVLRAEVAEQLTTKQRADLCQRLGVDAVAIAKVRYVIGDKGGFTIGGMGSTTIYPKAIVEFKVLDGTEVAVWKDRHAEGKPTKDGIENTMGVKDNAAESNVLIAAAKSGFDTLVERYKQQP